KRELWIGYGSGGPPVLNNRGARAAPRRGSPRARAHPAFISLRLYLILWGAPSAPSGFCCLYSNSRAAKLRLTWSIGSASGTGVPPLWKLDTITFVRMTL